MRRLFAIAAIAAASLALTACGPAKDYGQCLASHDEDHPPYTGYEYAPSGISMSGGIAMGGSGSYRIVMHPGYTETVCDQWEYPEGNGPNADR